MFHYNIIISLLKKKNLNTIFEYKIPHISCYALTVEPKTPLDKQIRLQKNLPVSDEHAAEQFEILMQQMSQNSYIHYEISNFAKKDENKYIEVHIIICRPLLNNLFTCTFSFS